MHGQQNIIKFSLTPQKTINTILRNSFELCSVGMNVNNMCNERWEQY